jgi:hypothetical protein
LKSAAIQRNSTFKSLKGIDFLSGLPNEAFSKHIKSPSRNKRRKDNLWLFLKNVSKLLLVNLILILNEFLRKYSLLSMKCLVRIVSMLFTGEVFTEEVIKTITPVNKMVIKKRT